MIKNESRSLLVSNRMASLCAGGLKIGADTLAPDESKAYVEFYISHAFPVVTWHGHAISGKTVSNSWNSMRHQVLNIAHLMKRYDKEKIARDRDIGTVVAVELANEHEANSGRLAPKPEDGVYIHGAAVLHKAAEGVDRIIGQHQSSKVNWTVSMEALYFMDESCLVLRDPNAFPKSTPESFSKSGYSVVSWMDAPKDLRRCVDENNGNMVTKKYKDCPVALMLGGLDGQVHYSGVALVQHGAEPTARIEQILAGRMDPAQIAQRASEGFGKILDGAGMLISK